MIKLLKPLSFLPAIFMMYMIFSFSSQDGVTSSELSYKVSYEIVEMGGKVIGADFETWEIDNLANRFHTAIRKIAHMTEYFLLAVAVSFPLYVYGLRGIFLMIVAGFFCVAFACGDEYHQSFISGRTPSRRDVLIDSFGVFWGIILVRIIGWTGRKTIFRPFCKKKKKLQQEPERGAAQPAYPGQQTNYWEQPAPGHPYYGQAPGGPVSYYPPRNGANQPPAGYQGQPYAPEQPYCPGGYPRQPYAPGPYPRQPYPSGNYQQQPAARQDTTSDHLSEDMSLKKLVHDIKDQKRETKHEKELK